MLKKGVIKVITLIVVLLVIVVLIVSINSYRHQKTIERFKDYLEEIKNEYDRLILEDDEQYYNKLINESKKIIKEKDINSIKNIKIKFDSLKKQVILNNSKKLDDILTGIKDTYISNNTNIDKINLELYKADKLLAVNDFKKVNEIINNIEELIGSPIDRNIAIKDIKLDKKICSEENIKEVINNYVRNLPSAIEQGDINILGEYIYPNSKLYNEQEMLVRIWHKHGIVEKFIEFVPQDIIISKGKLNAFVVSEEKFEIEENSIKKVKNFYWLYKLKYNETKGNYQITELSNLCL